MQTPPPADGSDVMLEEDALVGTSLGNYRLLERIGVGATALVYRAEHTQLGRIYAVKILHPSIAIRPGMRERFLREAKTAGQLNHENIIFIADFAIDPQLGPYMVMEYLEGENLQDVLERETSVPLPRLTQIATQVCKALSVAHEAGIIHRDLKPENIFLVPRPDGPEIVKILDFGIARLVQSTASLTGEGKLLGTPLYMSPEQCRGNSELTPASDLYSFGVVLFEMLTGRTPFVGDNPQKLLIDHFLVDPPELPAHYPESLRALQAELLAKSPEHRPASIDVVHDRLLTALQEANHFSAPPIAPFEASFTHEQLPALTDDPDEVLSALDVIEDLEPRSSRGDTARSPAFVPGQPPHESTQETSYPPTPPPRHSGREELSTQEQLPAANTPLPLTTPAPSSRSSQIAELSLADAVRQSPQWGDGLATTAWEAVPDDERAALAAGRTTHNVPAAQSSQSLRLGPGQALQDNGLTDPSRMTLQGSELSTNDVIEMASHSQPVVVKQRPAGGRAPGQGQDPLLNDLEHLFNHQDKENNDALAHGRSNDQPPLEADEELLRDLDQLNPSTPGWTQDYAAAAPAGQNWQAEEPVIELRQKKPPAAVRVERGAKAPSHTNVGTGASHQAAPENSAVRVEKGGKSKTPAPVHSGKPNAALVRTEIDLSLRDVYKISGQIGEDLDIEELLQIPTTRGETPPKKEQPEPIHTSTIQEGSQLAAEIMASPPPRPSQTPPAHNPSHSQPSLAPPQGLSFNHAFENYDQEPGHDASLHHPDSDARSSPTWIVLLFVLLAAFAGILVYWLWLRA